jgi:hypothetical protein
VNGQKLGYPSLEAATDWVWEVISCRSRILNRACHGRGMALFESVPASQLLCEGKLCGGAGDAQVVERAGVWCVLGVERQGGSGNSGRHVSDSVGEDAAAVTSLQ